MKKTTEREAAIRLKEQDKQRFRQRRKRFIVASVILAVVALSLGVAGLAMECLIAVLASLCSALQAWDADEIVDGVKRRPDRLLWMSRGNNGGSDSRADSSPNGPQPGEPSRSIR